ncbi:MAG: hypothetical protein KJ583_03825 [Nanoarchaeota archaeon]|nr:hypothetical protein [Nanoarchaeota archaeon]MBU1269537.1 hypothetical protein [Nanoarchaeota archaeon]MBU1604421.1 hypothetical protein [Nanoarchaeota archaeon]MBU2442429.1 hypothetical protein [Nanoarchaeota archaeon]
MNEKIKLLLKEYGLDDNETNIFICLVGKNQLSAYKIANYLGIHRSSCYDVLKRLVQKGFVSESNIKGKRLFSANELINVLGRIKSKESLLLAIIPEVESLQVREETFVRYVDSKGSFSEIDTKLYQLAREGKLTFGYMISNSPELTTSSSRLLIKRLLDELSKTKSLKNVDCRAIWDKKHKNNIFMKQFENLGKNRFLGRLPNKATTFIYDGYVTFIYLDETESFIEIKSKQVCEEMKAYFEYLWNLAEK